MNLLQPIVIYCERQNILFWSEPINALNNFLSPVTTKTFPILGLIEVQMSF